MSQKITVELTLPQALSLSHAAEAVQDDAAENHASLGWNHSEYQAYLRALQALNAAIAGAATGERHKDVAVLPVTAFYDRVAWLHFHGAYQEANALRELAPLFDPPITVDEGRIERRVAMFISDALRLSNQMIG